MVRVEKICDNASRFWKTLDKLLIPYGKDEKNENGEYILGGPYDTDDPNLVKFVRKYRRMND